MIDKETFTNEIEKLETTKEKGDYFLEVLSKEFFPEEEITFLDGSGDGGIDAYFTCIDENISKWSIIQSKHGSSYKGTDSICCDFSKIFIHLEDKEYYGKDNVFLYLRDFIKESSEKIIILYLLTDNKISDSELNSFKTIKNIFSERYNIKFEVENLYPDLLYEKTSTEKIYNIELPGNFIKDDGSGELVGKVKISDLFNFMKNFKSLAGDIKLLYKSNIRLYLSNKLAKAIASTLSNDPDKFFEYNNGITILTNGINYNEKGVLILCNPDCNNGCQTSLTIYKYIENSKIVPNSNLCVTIIDISKKSKEEIVKITECRNKQTAVKSVGSIFVLDKRVEEIKNILKNDYGKILQTKKGEYSPKKIDFVDLMSMCFCIIDGTPGIAKLKNAEHYNSKTGDDFITKLKDDRELLLLSYRLAEICELLNKRSYKYRVESLRYAQISILYTILEKAVGSDKGKMLKILNDNDLYDYFMKSATGLIRIYTDIKSRTKAKFLFDYENVDNLERLSKLLDLNTSPKLNELISSWFEFTYKEKTDIIDKVEKILKS